VGIAKGVPVEIGSLATMDGSTVEVTSGEAETFVTSGEAETVATSARRAR
jgi:hypothetical protein